MTGIQDNRKPAAGTAGQGEASFGAVRQTYFSAQGKPVASLDGHILRKRVRGSVHQLRKPAGWAIDCDILHKARGDGATVVEVDDVESGKVYTAAMRLFDLYGFKFDRGFGAQVGLPLKFWRVEIAGVRQLALWG
ncbi:MAG TPA: hypothetical protein DEQ80_11770 [Anaerolinea thermolimosa]|uniref:Uncharacterized protein n=1 Tax=Anaerolinea thermolimosa TaxID=229919 RepID=A0A3D1JJV1_9CHLR|nr:hypothetical protein [Anaerolinea thermolimosa]